MTKVERTKVEPTEVEELRGRILGIIGAYGMGVSFNPRELYLKNAPAAPPPEPVLGETGATSGTASYHVAGRGDGTVSGRRLEGTRIA